MQSSSATSLPLPPPSPSKAQITTAIPINAHSADPPPVFAHATPVHNLKPLKGVLNDGGLHEYLSSLRWPQAIRDAFLQNLSKIPIRYFIGDDSGSMATGDGKRLVVIENKSR